METARATLGTNIHIAISIRVLYLILIKFIMESFMSFSYYCPRNGLIYRYQRELNRLCRFSCPKGQHDWKLSLFDLNQSECKKCGVIRFKSSKGRTPSFPKSTRYV